MKNCPHTEIEIKENREIVYCDNLNFPWKQDPNGYFLLKVDRENKLLCCGFVDGNHKMVVEFRGKNPDKIIKEITRRNLCSKENLSYISSELMIAYFCLFNDKPYIQR
ncbi:MAG: hypothetical protein AABX77_01560 [Nanoarchaeota archaeon]